MMKFYACKAEAIMVHALLQPPWLGTTKGGRKHAETCTIQIIAVRTLFSGVLGTVKGKS